MEMDSPDNELGEIGDFLKDDECTFSEEFNLDLLLDDEETDNYASGNFATESQFQLDPCEQRQEGCSSVPSNFGDNDISHSLSINLNPSESEHQPSIRAQTGADDQKLNFQDNHQFQDNENLYGSPPHESQFKENMQIEKLKNENHAPDHPKEHLAVQNSDLNNEMEDWQTSSVYAEQSGDFYLETMQKRLTSSDSKLKGVEEDNQFSEMDKLHHSSCFYGNNLLNEYANMVESRNSSAGNQKIEQSLCIECDLIANTSQSMSPNDASEQDLRDTRSSSGPHGQTQNPSDSSHRMDGCPFQEISSSGTKQKEISSLPVPQEHESRNCCSAYLGAMEYSNCEGEDMLTSQSSIKLKKSCDTTNTNHTRSAKMSPSNHEQDSPSPDIEFSVFQLPGIMPSSDSGEDHRELSCSSESYKKHRLAKRPDISVEDAYPNHSHAASYNTASPEELLLRSSVLDELSEEHISASTNNHQKGDRSMLQFHVRHQISHCTCKMEQDKSAESSLSDLCQQEMDLPPYQSPSSKQVSVSMKGPIELSDSKKLEKDKDVWVQLSDETRTVASGKGLADSYEKRSKNAKPFYSRKRDLSPDFSSDPAKQKSVSPQSDLYVHSPAAKRIANSERTRQRRDRTISSSPLRGRTSISTSKRKQERSPQNHSRGSQSPISQKNGSFQKCLARLSGSSMQPGHKYYSGHIPQRDVSSRDHNRHGGGPGSFLLSCQSSKTDSSLKQVPSSLDRHYLHKNHSTGQRQNNSPRNISPHQQRDFRHEVSRRFWPPHSSDRKTGLGKPGRCLFVSGFNFLITERDLERKFSRYGRVRDVRVLRNRRSGHSRGYGFVTMGRDEEADAAIRALNNEDWTGRPIIVEKSVSRPR